MPLLPVACSPLVVEQDEVLLEEQKILLNLSTLVDLFK